MIRLFFPMRTRNTTTTTATVIVIGISKNLTTRNGSSHSHSHSQSHNHHHHHHNHVEDLNNNNILRQQEFQSHLPSLTHQPHHLSTSLLASQSHAHLTTQEPATIDLMNPSSFVNLTDLPKFPVPPGAKSSLFDAGLSQNQIDLLSALVAQHQAGPISVTHKCNSYNHTPLSVSPAELPLRINNSITTVAPITTTNVNVNANGIYIDHWYHCN